MQSKKLYDCSVELEVLAAMAMDHAYLIIAMTHLDQDCFFDPENSGYFGSIQSLIRKNVAVSRETVAAEYRAAGKAVPPKFDMIPIMDPNAMKIKAKMLKEYSVLRKVRNEMIEKAAALDVFNFRSMAPAAAATVSLLANNTFNEIEDEGAVRMNLINQLREKRKREVIKTGFWKIDDLVEGFGEGNLVVIAGRPAMGKTSFAGQLALNHKAAGHRVGFLSLEMSNEEISERFMANETHVPYRSIRSRDVAEDILDKYLVGMDESIKFVKNKNIKIDQLEPMIRILVKAENCRIIYIDHLEKLYDHAQRQSKAERFGYIMDRLKTTAQDLKVPIVIMHQINRDAEENKGSRPMLSDLKSSGAVEEWADIAMLIHRPEYYNRDNHDLRGQFDVDVAKNRFGPTGLVKMFFDPEFMRYTQEMNYAA